MGSVPMGIYANIEKIYRSPLAGIANKIAGLYWPCFRNGGIKTVDPQFPWTYWNTDIQGLIK